MRKYLAVAVVITTIILLDQLTKQWAEQMLTLHQAEPVTGFVNLFLTYNRGAAFSFLNDASGWQRWFFIVLTLMISSVLLTWLQKLPSKTGMTAMALALILGGAIGNLLDRIRLGHVIDFIDVYYQDWHWPAFNLADSAITLGAIMLALALLKMEKTPT
ncbi:MAG: lipoprotein signal peptidase [Gammaproteobacteria bacterium]|nr:MAG: lipoprotein signal peptidase [Gammaproteobacteria bacterium]